MNNIVMRYSMYLCVFTLISLTICFHVSHAQAAEDAKYIVGATESVMIEEAGLSFNARVDTGAKTSSIHAENIVLDDTEQPIGKAITFTLINKQGQSTQIQSIVDSVASVKTSEGKETRYNVILTITWKKISKRMLVNLNDRSNMKYGLLLGRNWLRNDFVVDVDRNNAD